MKSLKVVERVRAAARALSEQTGCPITVDVEHTPGESGFGLYVPDGWNWTATECHTSLNLCATFTEAARLALRDMACGVERIDEDNA